MARRIVVLVDMDAIVADLSKKWYADVNRIYGENITVENNDRWDFNHLLKNSTDEQVHDIIKAPGYYRDLEVIPGSQAALKSLWEMKQADGSPAFHILFCTSAHVGYYAVPDKLMWVDEHFPFIGSKEVITAYHKDLIQGDFLIDDSPRNLIQSWKKQPNRTTITIDYPYNRNVKVNFRAMDYANMEQAWAQIHDRIVSG